MHTVPLGMDYCVSLNFTREETESQRMYITVQFSAIKITADGTIDTGQIL